jgi:hypothetical protein
MVQQRMPAVRRMLTLSVATISFAVMTCRMTDPSQMEQVVTVCTLAANPGKFAGQTVTVKALVSSDGFHETSLRDPTCDGAGIALKTEPALEERPDVIAMRQAIFAGVPGTNGKKITGAFTGRFERHRRSRPLYVLIAKAANGIQIQQDAK